MAEAIR